MAPPPLDTQVIVRMEEDAEDPNKGCMMALHSPGRRPAHRRLLSSAKNHQDAVGFRLKEDQRAIADVERDLSILGLFLQQSTEADAEEQERALRSGLSAEAYLEELRRVDTSNIEDVMSMMAQSLSEKREARARAKARMVTSMVELQPLQEEGTSPGSQEQDDSTCEDEAGVQVGGNALSQEQVEKTRYHAKTTKCRSSAKDVHHDFNASERACVHGTTHMGGNVRRAKRRRPTTMLSTCEGPTPPMLPAQVVAATSVGPVEGRSQERQSQGPGIARETNQTTGASSGPASRGAVNLRQTAGADTLPQTSSSVSSFDVSKLECLKRHEAAMRKRQELIEALREKEEMARKFRARPIPQPTKEVSGGHNKPEDDGCNIRGRSAPAHGDRTPTESPRYARGGRKGSSAGTAGTEVERGMLERQKEWEEARERKLAEARAIKEKGDLVEVRDGPQLNSTRSSWERAKALHAEAQARAAEAEKRKQELEDLKQQVVRARYKALYGQVTAEAAGGTEGRRARRTGRARGSTRPSSTPDARQAQRPESPQDEHEVYEPQSETDDVVEIDEVDVLNGGAGAGDFGDDPLGRLLLDKPLSEVQRLLAEKFDIPCLRDPVLKPEKPRGKKGGRPRRLSSFESCVQAYGAAVGPGAEARTWRRKRRARAHSDPLGGLLSKGGSTTGKPWRLDEAWKKLMGSASERLDTDVASYAMDALKAVANLPAYPGPAQAPQNTSHPSVALDFTDDDTERDSDAESNVEMTQDEIAALINQYKTPPRSYSRHAVAERGHELTGGEHHWGAHHTVALDAADECRLQPYLRFEQGLVQDFFDPTSSSDKGRFRVHDARDFLPQSMHRKQDPGSLQDGVTLLVGKLKETPSVEKVITIMFDRKAFSAAEAEEWWSENRSRFVQT